MTPPDHIGKYVDLNLVGFGTYGSVFRAWDPDLDRYVAIKVMNAQFSQDEGSLARFQSEARFMARVDQHQNVVRVIELGEEERGLYMVMDYYPNGNLENLIRSEGQLSTKRAVSFALQIAAGLSAAHDAGIVHRDIKPQNVLLDDDFVCKVSDFGISASTDRSIYTAVGTPAYMPPEQKLGRRTDARADIYALGVTMYQMLTGDIPDELIQTEVPPDPRGQNPEIPERIVQIIFKAIELDADSRYPTIGDLIDDLNSYEEAEDGGQGTDRQTSAGSSPNASDNGLGNISRRTLAFASMAAVGVIAVVVAIVAIVMSSGGDGERSFTEMAVGMAGGGPDRISHTIESLASTTVEIPSKTVKVFVPAGSAPLNTTLIIEELLLASLPPLPAWLIPTQRAFEVSLVFESGSDAPLNNEVMVSVVFDDSDLAEAQGDSDRVVIGHFKENLGEWEELSTGVNWETNTAWAYVDSLSPFALLVRVSDEALSKVIAEEKPDSETNEPVSPSGKETSKSIAPPMVSNEKLPPKADEPPLKPSLSRIGWPILKIVSPHNGNPGDGISISGEGGYHVYSDGRIDESEREFDLYFNDIKIGSISCYNDRCGTTVNVPGGTTPGLYAIVVEGGSSLAFTVDVPAPVPSENIGPKVVVPQQYTLTVNRSPSYGGTVKGGGNYSSRDTATVTATPYQGYTFTGWSGACSGSGSCSVTMSSNKSVTATFSQQQYTLTVNRSPSYGGAVKGGGNYSPGDIATVIATPYQGYSFTGWSGACSGTGSCSVTMSSNKSVTATFSQQQYTLTVNRSPSYGGSVTGGGNYSSGDTATITATPYQGYTFTGWSGACYGSSNCSVTMSSNKSVTATFSQQEYTLTVNRNPSYGGTATGGGSYSYGEVATVTATPHQGYSFTGWSGACYGSSNCSVTMNSNKRVTATFSLQEYTLTTETTTSGSYAGGSVTGAGIYPYDTTVTVTHAADSGFTFTGWYGACSGSGNCTTTMDADKVVGANFSPSQYTLTTNVTPTAGGNVTGGETYSSGATATVTATPNSGYTFTGWSGACSGSGGCSVTMNSNKNVTATFAQEQQWAYGIDKYSFIDTISVSPTIGSIDTSISMTCTSTGVPTPRVELSYENASGDMRGFVETPANWQASGQCEDSQPMTVPGTYNWTSLVLFTTSESVTYRTFYMPNGDIKDEGYNVVGTHSLNIPQIVITVPTPTPTPTPTPVAIAAGTCISSWGTLGSGQSQFDYPYGIAVSDSGYIYIADRSNNRIQKFNLSGDYISEWNAPQNYEVAVDSDVNVYVTGDSTVRKYNSTGALLAEWGSSGTGNGQFATHTVGIAIDSDGNVYVSSDSRVQKFNASGIFILGWGGNGTGDGQFKSAYGIGIDSSNNVYVADRQNTRIQKFDSSGTFLTKWGTSGSGNGQFLDPRGVVVDTSNNVHVSDPDNHQIQKFNSSGQFLVKWGSNGSAIGEFHFPYWIGVEGSEYIYVVDSGNHRIQKCHSGG